VTPDLSSHRASPPFGRYQIILLGDRGTCVCKQLAQRCYMKVKRLQVELTQVSSRMPVPSARIRLLVLYCMILVGGSDEFSRFRSVDYSWFSVTTYNTGCTQNSGVRHGERQFHDDPAQRSRRRRRTTAWSRETTPSSRSWRSTPTTSQVSGLPPSVLGVCSTAAHCSAQKGSSTLQQV